jgi:hypothetical protein
VWLDAGKKAQGSKLKAVSYPQISQIFTEKKID